MTTVTKVNKIREINKEYNALLDIARALTNDKERDAAFKEADAHKHSSFALLFHGVAKPVVELRNVKHLSTLSEETPAYSGVIYVDGVKFCEVTNRGHGGGDDYHSAATTQTRASIYDQVMELDALISVTYPRDEKYDMAESLECMCHGWVWDIAEQKSFKSKFSRTVMMLDNDKIYSIKGKKSDGLIAAVRKKYPQAVILNTLSFDDAFKLYKKHG